MGRRKPNSKQPSARPCAISWCVALALENSRLCSEHDEFRRFDEATISRKTWPKQPRIEGAGAKFFRQAKPGVER